LAELEEKVASCEKEKKKIKSVLEKPKPKSKVPAVQELDINIEPIQSYMSLPSAEVAKPSDKPASFKAKKSGKYSLEQVLADADPRMSSEKDIKRTLADYSSIVKKLNNEDDVVQAYLSPYLLVERIRNLKQKNGELYAESTIKKNFNTIIRVPKYSKLFESYIPKEAVDVLDDLYNKLAFKDNSRRMAKTKDIENSITSMDVTLARVNEKYGQFDWQAFLIYMYSIVPLRDNYGNMKLVHQDSETSDKSVNYLVLNRDSCHMIMNEYKNVGKYGQITFSLNQSEKSMVQSYVLKYKLNSGDYLFPNQDDHTKPMTYDKKLTRVIKRILNELDIQTNKQNVNYLRHASITEYLSQPHIQNSQDARLQLALRAGHDPMRSQEYVRSISKFKELMNRDLEESDE
jgi:copper chaperone CopZ